MKQFWSEVGLAVVLGMLMPGIILNIITYSAHQRVTGSHETKESLQNTEAPILLDVLMKDGTVEEMGLESYLTGVVLAEMPASFEEEALKAQAVVARTYALRSQEKQKHDTASICTDSACCQAYISPEEYKADGGDMEDVNKIRNAVESTFGQVLTYDGDLIEATYFSCSGGFTEDALAVWGTDIPYLRSVSSPGEENATHFTDSVTFTASQICDLLDLSSESNVLQIDDIIYTAGGGVEKITICGNTFTGTEIRKLLNLRSTAFTISSEDGKITFNTRGFGHRVGMSQYGADAMAVSGSVYQEILQHYYPGTILENRFIDKHSTLG